MFQSVSFSVFALFLQLIFLILFGVFVRYPELAIPLNGTSTEAEIKEHGETSKSEVGAFYPFFQDIHVMIFIGFGFLMTFLKRYGFSSVGLNLLVAALVLQWGILTAGWILHFDHHVIHITISDMIGAEFAAAAVLISFGAVLGKVNAFQLLFMAIIEVVLFQVNEKIVFYELQASDIGDSMVVHAFGAYFGLAVARVLYNADVHGAAAKEGSVYHSDLFAMIGTVFLWLFWPSFNSVAAVGEGQYRAVINTYLALAACAVVAFAISALLERGKFDMVHIQNSTLAGGVAVGTMADMLIAPWAALLIGSIAAVLSVVGYRFITPFLSRRLGIHDTCGVHNLHGMPGVMSGIGGIIAAAVASSSVYGNNLLDIFPARATISAGEQAGRQAAGLAISVAIAIVGGVITGLLLRIPIWGQPKGDQVFDDSSFWTIPPGFPAAEDDEERSKHPTEIHMHAKNVVAPI